MTLTDDAQTLLRSSEREEWLTVKEFAWHHRLSSQAIISWIKDGRVVGEFRDGRWRLKVAWKRDRPLATPLERHLHHQGVYFIECQEFIKIGYGEDVLKRAKWINSSSPFACKPLAFIPAQTSATAKALEEVWHRRFWVLHERHEWFRGVPRLRDAITLEARPWPTRNVKQQPSLRTRYAKNNAPSLISPDASDIL